MKTIQINDKWKIVKEDDNNSVLTFFEPRKRKNKQTGEESEFIFEDKFYFPTVQACLKSFLNKSLDEVDGSIKDILAKILEVEATIKKLKI